MLAPEPGGQGIGNEFVEVARRSAGRIRHVGKREVPVIQPRKILVGLVGHRDRPGSHRVQLQAAVAHGGAIAIKGDVAWRNAPQGRMAAHGSGVTGETEIALAPHADPAV